MRLSGTKRSLFRKKTGFYDHDAERYFRIAGIDEDEQPTINDLFVSLKKKNLWYRARRFYPVPKTSLSAAAYCAKTLVPGSFINSPTHSDNGILFDGSTQYFHIDDSVLNVWMTLTTASNSYGIYNRADLTAVGTDVYLCGVTTATPTRSAYFNLTAADLLIARNYQNTNNLQLASQAACTGFYLASRTSSSLNTLYKDGVSVDTDTGASATIPPRDCLVGCRNSAAFVEFSPAGFAPIQWCFSWFGVGLTTQQAEDLSEIVQAYQTAQGRQV